MEIEIKKKTVQNDLYEAQFSESNDIRTGTMLSSMQNTMISLW